MMPDYGVPADVSGVLPWSWAEERLQRSRNYWLVTVSSGGRPHALPVWGVWLAVDSCFVFSCGPHARKARNIRDNPQVVVGADDTVECVSVEGRASLLEGYGREAAISAYASKYEADEGKQVALAAFVRQHLLFVVHPERAFGIVEREDEFAARATRWVW